MYSSRQQGKIKSFLPPTYHPRFPAIYILSQSQSLHHCHAFPLAIKAFIAIDAFVAYQFVVVADAVAHHHLTLIFSFFLTFFLFHVLIQNLRNQRMDHILVTNELLHSPMHVPNLIILMIQDII